MDNIVDNIAMTTFTGYGAHSQSMLGNLAQHCKSRSLSADQTGIKWAQLTMNQQIIDHIIGDQKCMKKRNIVDCWSIQNIKMIGDQ